MSKGGDTLAQKKAGKANLVRGLVQRKNERKGQKGSNPRPAIARQVKALRESIVSLKGCVKAIDSQIKAIENTIKELESTL
jgi:hypothetical protein